MPLDCVASAPDFRSSASAGFPQKRGVDPRDKESELPLLARAAACGDSAALDVLLKALEPLARGTARRAALRARRLGIGDVLSAEDLMQQAYLGLTTLATQYDPGAGAPLVFFTVRLRTLMWRYVRGIAHQRPGGRHLDVDSEAALGFMAERAAQRHASESGWSYASILPELYLALERLAPRERAILALSYGRGETNPAIAVRLGLTDRAVQMARSRALRQLRHLLRILGIARRPDGG